MVANDYERTEGPIIISGPSGSGKSTLLKRLFQDYPDKFGLSISHTTRNPRKGEENGREYHFITRPQFEQLIQTDGFVEWAEFSSNLYGTSRSALQQVQDAGKICVLDIELEGVKNVRKLDLPGARFLFIKPPAWAELERRLSTRGTETKESIALRLERAKQDMKYVEGNLDLYDKYIVNDDLDRAYGELVNYVF